MKLGEQCSVYKEGRMQKVGLLPKEKDAGLGVGPITLGTTYLEGVDISGP